MSRATVDTCKGLRTWLTLNLGGRKARPFAALTGTDWRALDAAAHLLELYGVRRSPETLEAFRIVVQQMQPTTRYFAFHAVAYLAEWDTRARVWREAGLDLGDVARAPRCEGDRAAWTREELAAIDARDEREGRPRSPRLHPRRGGRS